MLRKIKFFLNPNLGGEMCAEGRKERNQSYIPMGIFSGTAAATTIRQVVRTPLTGIICPPRRTASPRMTSAVAA